MKCTDLYSLINQIKLRKMKLLFNARSVNSRVHQLYLFKKQSPRFEKNVKSSSLFSILKLTYENRQNFFSFSAFSDIIDRGNFRLDLRKEDDKIMEPL